MYKTLQNYSKVCNSNIDMNDKHTDSTHFQKGQPTKILRKLFLRMDKENIKKHQVGGKGL